MSGEAIGIAVWVFIAVAIYLLWLGSDFRKDDDHWDD